MPPFFEPRMFGTEIVYTVLVVFICFFIYAKTRELYELTKYGGIKYFRNAFLFFGIAYAARFAFFLFQLGSLAFDYYLPRRHFFPFSGLLMGYFGTMALFFLAYSIIWKKVNYKSFLIISNCVAIVVAIVSHLTRSPMMISFVQLPLLAFTLFASANEHKKKSHAKGLYILVALFWLANIFALGPPWAIAPEFRIFLDLASLTVFALLAHKVTKWTK